MAATKNNTNAQGLGIPLCGLLRLVLIGAAIAPLGGCHSVLELAKRTNIHEPYHYDLTPEECEEMKLYRQWADEAWSYASESGVVSEDFYDGFVSGFVDHVFAGGDGVPPAVPPRKYWKISSRSTVGATALQEWTDGFRRGALVAIEGGYRQRVISPLAQRLVFPDKLDEYRNQVRTRRAANESMMLESLDEGWVEEGTGLPIVPAPIDVDAVPDAPSIDELGNGELMIIEPTLDEGSGTRAPAGLSTDPAGEEGLDTDVSGLDENIDPFQDMETEQESGDRIDDVMEIPSGPEVRLLDDDLSSFPRRKSFGDYRSIIQASQGNGASTAYAEAVASAAARRGEGHATLEWRSPNGKPGPQLNGIRNAGFNQTSGESKAVGLPKPIHGSTRRRANLRTTEDVSKSIDRRFQDLDALESRDENESPIWGSRFQPQ